MKILEQYKNGQWETSQIFKDDGEAEKGLLNMSRMLPLERFRLTPIEDIIKSCTKEPKVYEPEIVERKRTCEHRTDGGDCIKNECDCFNCKGED